MFPCQVQVAVSDMQFLNMTTSGCFKVEFSLPV